MFNNPNLFRGTLVLLAISFFMAANSLPSLAKATDAELLRSGRVIVTTEEQPTGEHFVKARLLVHAPPQLVWDAVHVERQRDPDLAYSRIVEQHSPQEALLEEKFVSIPVIGSATCLMQMKEVPIERIEFKMIKSDHFKAMEGYWLLTPADGGKSTILELKSRTEMGFAVPHMFVDGIAGKKLEKRISRVKDMSETQARVATTGVRGQS